LHKRCFRAQRVVNRIIYLQHCTEWIFNFSRVPNSVEKPIFDSLDYTKSTGIAVLERCWHGIVCYVR
jgi:hypothetical protein